MATRETGAAQLAIATRRAAYENAIRLVKRKRDEWARGEDGGEIEYVVAADALIRILREAI